MFIVRSGQLRILKNTRSNHDVGDRQIRNTKIQKETRVPELELFFKHYHLFTNVIAVILVHAWLMQLVGH